MHNVVGEGGGGGIVGQIRQGEKGHVNIYSAMTSTGPTQGFLTNQKPIHWQRISNEIHI